MPSIYCSCKPIHNQSQCLHSLILTMNLGEKCLNHIGIFLFHYQRTPLHAAAEGGHVDTVKYLVTKEAGIDTKDEFGVNAADL